MQTTYLNILVLTCIFCWGAWGIFDKKALAGSNNREVLVALYTMFIPEIPLLLAILNFTQPGWHISPEVMFWSALGSFTSTLSLLAYLVALSKAEASYVLGITASYPLVMQLLAWSFLGESLVFNRMLGSLLIGTGVTVIGHSAKHAHADTTPNDRRIIFLCIIVATLGWGLHGLFDKRAVTLSHPLVVFLARCLCDVVSLLVMLLICRARKLSLNMASKRLWKFSSLSALSLAVGYFAYLTAMSISSASYVIVITGCYPLLMYVFALVFLKEKLNVIRLLGVCLVVLGGLLVQITQSQ